MNGLKNIVNSKVFRGVVWIRAWWDPRAIFGDACGQLIIEDGKILKAAPALCLFMVERTKDE